MSDRDSLPQANQPVSLFVCRDTVQQRERAPRPGPQCLQCGPWFIVAVESLSVFIITDATGGNATTHQCFPCDARHSCQRKWPHCPPVFSRKTQAAASTLIGSNTTSYRDPTPDPIWLSSLNQSQKSCTFISNGNCNFRIDEGEEATNVRSKNIGIHIYENRGNLRSTICAKSVCALWHVTLVCFTLLTLSQAFYTISWPLLPNHSQIRYTQYQSTCAVNFVSMTCVANQ